jgi:hypothetical protein
MTNISKRKISDKEYSALEKQLTALIERMNSKNAQSFLSSVLGESEKTMLIKRVAAILMIHHGYSTYATASILRLSTSTTNRYYTIYTSGGYEDFITGIYKQKNASVLLKKVFKLMDNINAPLTYDRWRYLRLMK